MWNSRSCIMKDNEVIGLAARKVERQLQTSPFGGLPKERHAFFHYQISRGQLASPRAPTTRLHSHSPVGVSAFASSLYNILCMSVISPFRSLKFSPYQFARQQA